MKIPDGYVLDGPEYHRDPYPLFSDLTCKGAVHPVRFPSVHAWLVTGYDAARRALTDPRLGKDHHRANPNFRAKAAIMPEPHRSQLQVHLLHRDGERHATMRSLITETFSARGVETQRTAIREDVHSLIDELPPFATEVSVDLASEFATKLPMLSLARAIGLPDALRDRFVPAWRNVIAPVAPGLPGREYYEQLLAEMRYYIEEVVDSAQSDTLLRRIVDAAVEQRITPAERDSMIFQLLAAGQDPVAAQLELVLITLFNHPTALVRLREEPGRVPLAVEELLRFDAAFNLTTWRFLERDDTINGTHIPAGDSVIVALGAANRDPRTFECPDTLQLDRNPNPHLTFGFGRHACPAAALARIELQEALAALLVRLEGLRLGCDARGLEWSRSPITRAVSYLPVHYTSRADRA